MANYVPVLKWKLGERRALDKLTDDIQNLISPIIEIQPNSLLKETNDDVKNEIVKIAKDFSLVFRTNSLFYLDLSNYDDFFFDGDQAQTTHPSSEIIYAFKSQGKIPILLIPLSWIDQYDKNVAFLTLAGDDDNGYAFRLKKHDLMKGPKIINNFIMSRALDREKVDLVLDLGEITEMDIEPLTLGIAGLLFGSYKRYRKIILIGTGYPTEFPSEYMGSERYKEVLRTELFLWRELRDYYKENYEEDLPTNLIFGDYGVTNSLPMPRNVSFMRPSAMVRYTTKKSWHIFKGTTIVRGGSEQYHELCSELIKRKDDIEVQDETYSWGDNYIHLCAQKKCSPGNPATWVSVATNHHITYVAQQLANPDFLDTLE